MAKKQFVFKRESLASLLKKFWRRIILAFPDKVSLKRLSLFSAVPICWKQTKKNSTSTTFLCALALFQQMLARANRVFPLFFGGLAMSFQKRFAINFDCIKNSYMEAINKGAKSAKHCSMYLLLELVFIAKVNLIGY